jgi:hypothetical protein
MDLSPSLSIADNRVGVAIDGYRRHLADETVKLFVAPSFCAIVEKGYKIKRTVLDVQEFIVYILFCSRFMQQITAYE